MYDRPVTLSIPPGTVHGQVFRLEFENEQISYVGEEEVTKHVMWVTVSVGENENFKVNDSDLETTLELTPALAWLGGTSSVKTPAKNVGVKVNELTGSHNVIVVAGEGLKTGNSIPGDLVVRTSIRVPTKLSWRQSRIIKRLASLEAEEPDKLVFGVQSMFDHKLEVNVVDADRVNNQIVKEKVVKRMEKPISVTVREKLGLPPAKPKPSNANL